MRILINNFFWNIKVGQTNSYITNFTVFIAFYCLVDNKFIVGGSCYESRSSIIQDIPNGNGQVDEQCGTTFIPAQLETQEEVSQVIK